MLPENRTTYAAFKDTGDLHTPCEILLLQVGNF